MSEVPGLLVKRLFLSWMNGLCWWRKDSPTETSGLTFTVFSRLHVRKYYRHAGGQFLGCLCVWMSFLHLRQDQSLCRLLWVQHSSVMFLIVCGRETRQRGDVGDDVGQSVTCCGPPQDYSTALLKYSFALSTKKPAYTELSEIQTSLLSALFPQVENIWTNQSFAGGIKSGTYFFDECQKLWTLCEILCASSLRLRCSDWFSCLYAQYEAIASSWLA